MMRVLQPAFPLRLMALDMDGTVLNDEKVLERETEQAIHLALKNGKEIVFCTGRSLAEMGDILVRFPDMHYLLGESGALVYDLQQRKPLFMETIPRRSLEILQEVAAGRDVMTVIFSEGRCVMNRSQAGELATYQMGAYSKTMPQVATLVEDAMQHVLANGWNAEKVNLFHRSTKDQGESRRRLDLAKPDLVYVDSEISALECSPPGVDKGTGLARLAAVCKIPVREMAMVGDGNNDLAALRTAGFSVAMGNANDVVKAVCQVQVADNNHGGCAEAIHRYLLQDLSDPY